VWDEDTLRADAMSQVEFCGYHGPGLEPAARRRDPLRGPEVRRVRP
jgi:hypothetical protein